MTLRLQVLSDRLGCRGGADWHLQGILSALAESGAIELRLAVGRRDSDTSAPCAVSLVPALGARTEEPAVDTDLRGDWRPDLLHLQNVVNPAVLRLAAAQPAVITIQDHRFFCPGRGKWTAAGQPCREPLAEKRCRRCFSEPTYFRAIFDLTRARLEAVSRMTIVVLSDYMRDELIAAGLSCEQIQVVPPFVHGFSAGAASGASELELEDQPCALFVGRLVAAKGPLEALEAWSRTGLDLPLVFAGNGSLRQELEARNAQVCGWLDRHRLARLYRRSRVLLMPSRWQEPFGIAGLEAQSFGLPVAAWDSGGISEWCPPAGLAPWGEIDTLSEKAAALVHLGSIQHPPGFQREELMGKLLTIYQQAAGKQ